MPQHLKLNIPEPCQENWNAMTPSEQGRHCKSCNKVVIDFTTMSDAQIIEYFKSVNTKTCGRLLGSQINRNIHVVEITKRNTSIQYIAVSMLAAQLFSYRSYAAPDTISQPTVQVDSNSAIDVDSCAPIATDTIIADSIAYDWTSKSPDTLNGLYAPITREIIEFNGDIIVCGGIGMQTLPERELINPWYRVLISPFLFGRTPSSSSSNDLLPLMKASNRTTKSKPHPHKGRQLLNWLSTLPKRIGIGQEEDSL